MARGMTEYLQQLHKNTPFSVPASMAASDVPGAMAGTMGGVEQNTADSRLHDISSVIKLDLA